MKDTFELTLNNPLTDEEWDMLTDVDFDKTDRITFETKHGKHVEFTKVIRCKDCRFRGRELECTQFDAYTSAAGDLFMPPDWFYCGYGKRKEYEQIRNC